MRNGRRWYLVAVGLVIAGPWLLGRDTAAYTYLLAALTLPPIISVLRRAVPGSRTPWWLLLTAMTALSIGNGFITFGGPAFQATIEAFVTGGHATLLFAAITLVRRRARNDIGGMLDVSVAALGLGGLLWTALLFPELQRRGAAGGDQMAILVSILVLAGVLGALLRVWFAGGRLPALGYLLLGLTVALVGNIALARTTGALVAGRDVHIELLFMIAYGCVGLAMLQPSVFDLTVPGAAPADKLSTGRLVLLALALVAGPVTGGLREMIGLTADGPLLAVGSLLVTPLVMIRVGRLARQRELAESRLRHQATHDLLTGLPNRAELLTRLTDALDRERAAGQASVVLLFCDLNGFKAVNDRLGHLAGDQLLTEVGRRIRAGLRAGDTLARYGGDEFLLLCEDSAQADAALRLTEHVREALAAPFLLSGEPVSIGSSVGAMISDGDLGADELISRADQAMYRAKQRYRAERADQVVRGSLA
ncbi:diguanylate cyclase domain-containing protein [Micromonosporaceae bacterium Da 78-11]